LANLKFRPERARILGSSKGTFDRAAFGLRMWGSGVSRFLGCWLASVGASFFGGANSLKYVRLELGADNCFQAFTLISNILAVD
jgi:hypothetical protein